MSTVELETVFTLMTSGGSVLDTGDFSLFFRDNSLLLTGINTFASISPFTS